MEYHYPYKVDISYIVSLLYCVGKKENVAHFSCSIITL